MIGEVEKDPWGLAFKIVTKRLEGRWKAQTRREVADEMAWRADREMNLPPDLGARHLAK